MSSVVPEELSHSTSGVRSQVLQRGRVRCRRADDDCVLHGIGICQSFHDLGDGGSLLTNSYIDAVQLGFLILTIIESLLIDDCVDCNCCLAINTQTTCLLIEIAPEQVQYRYCSRRNNIASVRSRNTFCSGTGPCEAHSLDI